MKTKVTLVLFLMTSVFSGFGQVTSAGARGFQVQFLEEEKQLLWIDFREGLLIPAEDIILKDSISIKFLGQFWNYNEDLADVGITEYIPAGQNRDNWEEIVTVQRIDIGLNKARKVYDELNKIREERCPGGVIYSRILEESKNKLIYESRVENCSGFEDQSEIKIIFVPKFDLLQHTVWIVEYTRKFDEIDPGRRTEVISWLKAQKLLNNKELQPYLKKMTSR